LKPATYLFVQIAKIPQQEPPMAVTIFEENTFYTNQNVSAAGTVTVEKDAYIYGVGGDNALEIDVVVKAKIDGCLLNTDANGLALYDTGVPTANSTVTIGTEGVILSTAVGFGAIVSTQAANVTNAGHIQGIKYGILLQDLDNSTSKSVTITNAATGLIRADEGIRLDSDQHKLVLTNKGTIDGDVLWAAGSTITNSGVIGPLAQLNNDVFANTITNSGQVNGGINLGDGNDVLANSGGVASFVDLAGGNNKVTNSGSIGDYLTLGSGNDTVSSTLSIGKQVELGNGNNTLTNSGLIGDGGGGFSVAGGLDNDTVTNSGSLSKAIRLGEGTNKVANSGSVGAELSSGSGNDTLTNSATGNILSFVNLGDGNNTLTNNGKLGDDVILGSGKDKVTNTGTIDGVTVLAGGDDSMTNSGTVSFGVALGQGINALTNKGFIGAGITADTGSMNTITNSGSIILGISVGDASLTLTNRGLIDDDVTVGIGLLKLTNSGTINGEITSTSLGDSLSNSKIINGDVNLGIGKNTITNSGSIFGTVTTGSDDDVMSNTGTVSDLVDLGGGNDKFTGGNNTDVVSDDLGNDTYTLGGGNDFFTWFAEGTDKVDGGAGTRDQLFFTSAPAGVHINLDSKLVTLIGVTIAASTATCQTGSLAVKGFEVVNGGTGDDFMAGGTGNEFFFGSGGHDWIHGGKGADTIGGGADSDRFFYFATTDSGVTKATRDTITDFQGAAQAGGDLIDLEAIDADTTIAGNQAFATPIGGNVPFTAAGQLRWVHQVGETIIQGDLNGDGAADFSIAVTGIQTFNAADFVL
jgi:hypothetical protein